MSSEYFYVLSIWLFVFIIIIFVFIVIVPHPFPLITAAVFSSHTYENSIGNWEPTSAHDCSYSWIKCLWKGSCGTQSQVLPSRKFARSWNGIKISCFKVIFSTTLKKKILPLLSRISILVALEKKVPCHPYKFLLFLQENSREFYKNSKSFT